MATLVTITEVDPQGLAALRRPRQGLVAEEAADDGAFAAAEGPVRQYRRTLAADDLDDGRTRVTERIDFALAIPLWWPLFVLPVKWLLRREHRAATAEAAAGDVRENTAEVDTEVSRGGYSLPIRPFWAPPNRFNARSSSVLALVCAASLVTGYVGTIITQTITYSASEFHRSTGAQGVTLAGVRVGVLVALIAAAAADRQGRRRLLLLTLYGSCLTASVGALSPDLVVLGITQAVAQGLSTAALLLIAIMVAEEVPAGSRAWAVGVLTMTNALGAGVCVWVLPLADVGVAWWRALYVLALLGIPLVAWTGRQLPESRRFVARRHGVSSIDQVDELDEPGAFDGFDEPEEPDEFDEFDEFGGSPSDNAPAAPTPRERTGRVPSDVAHRRRFWVLAIGLFGIAVFGAPATQLLNDFLRHERGYSAAHISAFTLLTNTPAGIGILVGGWLADVRGRRVVAAIGVVGGTALTVFQFLAHGWPMWGWSVSATVLAAIAVPAFGVYGAELFPTTLRGRVNGLLSVVTVMGSAVGLGLAGWLKDSFGHLGPAMAVLSVAPLLVAVLVLLAYPETSGWELEDLNPEDRTASPATSPVPP